VCWDENGERRQKYDRAKLFSFVQVYGDEEIACVVNEEGEENRTHFSQGIYSREKVFVETRADAQGGFSTDSRYSRRLLSTPQLLAARTLPSRKITSCLH
jgi:hypothetical protein